MNACLCWKGESGLVWKKDFFVGYSPERINPGDRQHTVSTITKVVSGDTPETLEKVADVYGSVVKAGVFRASSIKVAEAAKVIENTQRDINIALMNELRIIFDKMGISTRGRAAGGQRPNGISCPSSPGSSAATASALTRTTSPTRRRRSATTRRSSWPAGA